MKREVWVWVQHRLGEPNPVAAEAMTAGEILAARAGGCLACVAVGWAAREVYRGGVARGAEVVYAIEDPILRNNLDDRRLTAALVRLVQEKRPLAILFDGTATGQGIAARVAAALGVTMVGEAGALTYRDGAVIQRSALFGGSIITEVSSRGETAVIVLQPGIWNPRRPERGRTGQLVEIAPARDLPPVGVVIEDLLGLPEPAPAPRTVVVSGSSDAGLSARAQDLAQALGGRWMSVDEWGLNWTPRLDDLAQADGPVVYITLGVAGAFRRRAGSSGREVVVAVHPDPAAPIYRTATYGIVSDPGTVVEALLQHLRSP